MKTDARVSIQHPFFLDVDAVVLNFVFLLRVVSQVPEELTECAFFLQDVSELEELDDCKRCFPMTAEDLFSKSIRTQELPRSSDARRDAELTKVIYERSACPS